MILDGPQVLEIRSPTFEPLVTSFRDWLIYFTSASATESLLSSAIFLNDTYCYQLIVFTCLLPRMRHFILGATLFPGHIFYLSSVQGWCFVLKFHRFNILCEIVGDGVRFIIYHVEVYISPGVTITMINKYAVTDLVTIECCNLQPTASTHVSK